MTGVKGSKWGVIAPIDWAACGTPANYKRHLRLGESPCAACRRANAEYTVTRRLRLAASAARSIEAVT